VSTSGTWRVSVAALRTPAMALVILAVGLALAEMAARRPGMREVLGTPSIGSPSRGFELQLNGLEQFASRLPVDCIVVGNSTAQMGVDPAVLDGRYLSLTGRDLHCFNFGVAGMTAGAAGAVATILVQRYHPRLLLYVVSARDVGESVDGPLLESTPWVRYQLGSFSSEGWLVEHSAAFRYYLLYRQWLEPSAWRVAASEAGTTDAGFLRARTRLPLAPEVWAHAVGFYSEIAREPPSPSELAGYARVLSLSGPQTRVIVIEAPAHERLRRWARRSTRFYGEAMRRMRDEARRRRVPFWRVPTWRVVPADGWSDFVHLDGAGATSFSEWLATRLATRADGATRN